MAMHKFIEAHLPHAILLRDFNSQFVFQVPLEGFRAEKLFHEMEDSRSRLQITDWGIS